jgi:predicted Rossmann fold flavoprotein
MSPIDIGIVGAGAAGLTAAIFAGQASAAKGRPSHIVLLDGARKVGAKILVSGGGRCNVTHRAVSESDFAGGPRPIIRNVLRAFDVEHTLGWMKSLGVELKLEPTGKYFPVTDESRTVLDALLRRVEALGVRVWREARVTGIRPVPGEEGFEVSIQGLAERLRCRRMVFATGGLSLPKSGSDGAGLEMLRSLGHTIIPTTPALVPLVLRAGAHPGGRFAELSGVSADLRVRMRDSSGRTRFETTGPVLFTHFGLSGPAVMDFSRHWLRARLEHPEMDWPVCLGYPDWATPREADTWLLEQARLGPRRSLAVTLADRFPERLARVLAEGLPNLPSESATSIGQLPRAARLALANRLACLPIEVVDHRGWSFAETTAGGASLREVQPRSMESRICRGLYLCGELLDADGRIGGFSFQWAWATGFLAGRSAAESLATKGSRRSGRIAQAGKEGSDERADGE